MAVLASLPALARDTPREVLKRALTKQRSLNSSRVETRPGNDGSQSWQVKVQTVAKRGIKVAIIAPISKAGIVSVDDAQELKIYRPDEGELIIQPSPFLLQPSVKWRLELIDKNYKIKFGGKDEIAEQIVREIILEPVQEDVPVRRLFIDTKHDAVLKYVVDPEDAPEVVSFNTKQIEFGLDVASQDFALPRRSSDATVRRVPGPKEIGSPVDSKSAAGFLARMPAIVPCGFKPSGTYLFSDPRGSYVGVKLSDGMASITVFQWHAARFKSSPTPGIKIARSDAYGVRYGIAVAPGEYMPESVLEKILEVYVSKSE